MAKKLDRFILELCEKAGIQPTDPRLLPLLSHATIKEVDVPDEIEREVQTNLLSVSDAKANHPVIKQHYFAETMANVDRALNDIYSTFGFTPEEVAAFNAERSSTKRIGLVAAKFKEKVDAAKSAAPQGDKETKELTRQVNDLNTQLAAVKQQLTDKETEFKNQLSNIETDNYLSSQFASIKTVYDNLPTEIKSTTLKNIIQKELQDKGVTVVKDENGSFVLRRKDGTNYFDENNRQVSIADFVNGSFAKMKILPQNENSASNNGQQQQQQANSGEQNNGNPGIVSGNQQNNNQQQTPKRDLSSLFNSRKESLDNKNPVTIV